MTKKKHPTIKSLRPGQTVHVLYYGLDHRNCELMPPIIKRYPVCSDNHIAYIPGEMITKFRISHLKKLLAEGRIPKHEIFYSRRKAETYLKNHKLPYKG